MNKNLLMLVFIVIIVVVMCTDTITNAALLISFVTNFIIICVHMNKFKSSKKKEESSEIIDQINKNLAQEDHFGNSNSNGDDNSNGDGDGYGYSDSNEPDAVYEPYDEPDDLTNITLINNNRIKKQPAAKNHDDYRSIIEDEFERSEKNWISEFED